MLHFHTLYNVHICNICDAYTLILLWYVCIIDQSDYVFPILRRFIVDHNIKKKVKFWEASKATFSNAEEPVE